MQKSMNNNMMQTLQSKLSKIPASVHLACEAVCTFMNNYMSKTQRDTHGAADTG